VAGWDKQSSGLRKHARRGAARGVVQGKDRRTKVSDRLDLGVTKREKLFASGDPAEGPNGWEGMSTEKGPTIRR